MKYYAAPLEGITGYIYRNAHHRYYPGIDKYFAPFISPRIKRGMSRKEKNDLAPVNNRGIYLVPQILTNRSGDFVDVVEILMETGYSEINLNLGCPSGTVFSKGKGCGFLRDHDVLRRFFTEVMDGLEHRGLSEARISVKTRLGIDDPEEILGLMDIYNSFPLNEVILHARIHKDFYKRPANKEAFGKAAEVCRHPLSYNGDIFTVEDFRDCLERFPGIDAVMFGRGMTGNPQLPELCCQSFDRPADKSMNFDLSRFFHFHDEVLEGYREVLSGEKNVLFKMKELWCYMESDFPGREKTIKKIKKAGNLDDYHRAVSALYI